MVISLEQRQPGSYKTECPLEWLSKGLFCVLNANYLWFVLRHYYSIAAVVCQAAITPAFQAHPPVAANSTHAAAQQHLLPGLRWHWPTAA